MQINRVIIPDIAPMSEDDNSIFLLFFNFIYIDEKANYLGFWSHAIDIK